MINIWEYARRLRRLTIYTVDGRTYTGDTIAVMDKEETDDEEDSIILQAGKHDIQIFFTSQIERIEEAGDM